MKYFFLFATIMLASAQIGRSQCAPNNPTGNVGFFPATDLLPCVERGVYYDQTFYLENVDSFVFQGFGVIRVDTFRIDSIVNLPCNLRWISDRGDNTYLMGETGCIRIYGTSTDSVGQYKLKVYVTIVASLLGKLQGDINQIIDDLENLAGNLGVDFEYFVRVKEPATNCPSINRNNNYPLIRTAQKSCNFPGMLTADITGDTLFCNTSTGQLTVQVSNAINPSVTWLPANAVSNPNGTSTNLNLTNSTYVTVKVTDTANTGNTYFDRVWVLIDTAVPVPSFTETINGRSIKLTAATTNASTYSWNFGDQATETGTVALHTYAANGVYPVSLTVSNSCGSDTYVDTLYIGNVGINAINTENTVACTVFPNPAHGNLNVEVQGLSIGEEFIITIVDLSGKTVVKPITYQYQSSSKHNIPVDVLSPGIYIFQIKSLHSSAFRKIVIN